MQTMITDTFGRTMMVSRTRIRSTLMKRALSTGMYITDHIEYMKIARIPKCHL